MNFTDIANFIDLVKNPDKYDAALKQLAEREKAVKEMISIAGKANEIPKLHELAELKLSKAEEEAKDVVVKAKAAAEKVLADARVVEQAAIDKKSAAETAFSQAASAKREADQISSDFYQKTIQLDKRIEAQLKKEVEFSKQQQELNDKLAKLRNIGL